MDSRSKDIDRLHAITSSDDVRLPCTAPTATRPRVFDSRKKGLASLGAKTKVGERLTGGVNTAGARFLNFWATVASSVFAGRGALASSEHRSRSQDRLANTKLLVASVLAGVRQRWAKRLRDARQQRGLCSWRSSGVEVTTVPGGAGATWLGDADL
jgi:hypothetical protein